MKVIERGHIYELHNRVEGVQRLQFFKDLPDGEPGHDGVLCQEVIRAVIDRLNELHVQVPSHENVDIVVKLRESLILLEQRAFRRTLGKSYAKTGQHVEQLPTLGNGHLFDHECRQQKGKP